MQETDAAPESESAAGESLTWSAERTADSGADAVAPAQSPGSYEQDTGQDIDAPYTATSIDESNIISDQDAQQAKSGANAGAGAGLTGTGLIAVVVWGIGAASFLLWGIVSYLMLEKKLRATRAPAKESDLEILKTISQKVKLYRSRAAQTPLLLSMSILLTPRPGIL